MTFPQYNPEIDYLSLHDKILGQNYQIMEEMKKSIYELTNL